MNFRQTAVLLGAVFAVVVLLLVLTFTAEPTAPVTDLLTEELVGVKPEDIDTVEMDRDNGGRLKLVRLDAAKNTWEFAEPFRAPADGPAVLAVVTALMKAKPTASNELTSNPSVHGLDPPSLRVTLRQGDSKSATVNLGDVGIGGSKAQVYVTTSKRTRPMAVPRGELDSLLRDSKGSGKFADLAKWVSDFRVKSVFPSDSRAMGEDVAMLKLTLPNKNKDLTLSRTPTGEWKFDSPAGWGEADVEGDPNALPNALTGVTPLLRALSNVAAIATADFIDTPKDPKEYGLNDDNPDRIRVEMKTKDGQKAVVDFGKFEGGAAPPPKLPGMPPQSSSEKVYVHIVGQPGVIRASAANLSGLAALIAEPDPLRDRDLIRIGRGKSIDGVDILLTGQAPDKPTKLRKVGSDWKLYGGPGDPQNARAETAKKIADVLSAKRSIVDFPKSDPANFTPVAATVYVWVDGFSLPGDSKAEPTPKEKVEPTKLEFGKILGEKIYVRRTLPGGAVNEFALPTMLAVTVDNKPETLPVLATVSKTRLDLLDPSLPSFAGAMSRIAVSGANNYVLVREPDPATKEFLWRFAEPPPEKGKVADSNKVTELLSLLVTSQRAFGKFVDEAPANPAEYGLAPPRLKVLVGPDGKSESERGFEFGRDTADPDKVYARVVGRSAVFTIQRQVFDQFLAPDLRDRLVFRGLRPDEATRVELRGWVGLIGTKQIRVNLEKKDGVWVVPPAAPGAPPNAPEGFRVDPVKVNAFLNLLAATPVKTFEKDKLEPENGKKHGLRDEDPFLEIKVFQPSGVFFLIIGSSPDGGATDYAVTNMVPAANPVITIDAAPFKPYKEKPNAFGLDK